jgi:DNA-binding MarR family transcriptional regulator
LSNVAIFSVKTKYRRQENGNWPMWIVCARRGVGPAAERLRVDPTGMAALLRTLMQLELVRRLPRLVDLRKAGGELVTGAEVI